MPSSLAGLNAEQSKAVTTVHGPVLVLAGPGSGKTRVLTRRIAYLIDEAGVAPWHILAVTFTNKAAGEMRGRVAKIFEDKFGPPPPGEPPRLGGLTIGTFHSIGARVLRVETAHVGYQPNWVIYDSADQLALVRAVLSELNVDEKRFSPKAIHAHISKLKNDLVTPETYRSADYFGEIAGRVYRRYQDALVANNAMDFDDLLMRTVLLLRDNIHVRVKYQDKWRFVLVDEFQDTNAAQYELIRLLAMEPTNNGNIFVVGDEDQCVVAGTVISTPGGNQSVQSLRTGDRVIAAGGHGLAAQAEIDRVTSREYQGPMLTVLTKGGRTLSATPEHSVFARFSPYGEYLYVYLMYGRTHGFRIGRTGATRTNGAKIYPGFKERLRQERADAIWLLRACKDQAEAAYWESFLAAKYGLPTACFHTDGRRIALNEEMIGRLFRDLDTMSAAQRLAADLHLSLDHPHHVPQSTIRGSSVRKSITLTMFGSSTIKTGASRWRAGTDAWHLHELSICSSDEQFRQQIETVTPTRPHKQHYWTARRAHGDYDEFDTMLGQLSDAAPDAHVFKRARLTEHVYDFLPIGHLQPGALIPVLGDDGTVVEDEVSAVQIEHYAGQVYDLSVPTYRTYIANGFVVHNSIYRFRGADYRNVQLFRRDYPDAAVVMLEQNYRSTQTILDVANAVISNNRNRTPKRLRTDNGQGVPAMLYEAYNEIEEASFVADEIQKLIQRREYGPGDFAVAYRTNAQSRAMEEAFVLRGMKYKLVGATRFYERKEVKDALAYLRLIHNPADSVALSRIINEPARGIGDKTRSLLRDWAGELGESEFVALQVIHHGPARAAQLLGRPLGPSAAQVPVSGRAQKALADFSALLEDWIAQEVAGRHRSVADLLDAVLVQSRYLEVLRDGTEEGEDRFENLQELRAVAAQYVQGMPDLEEEQTPLAKFLEEVSLVSDTDDLQENSGAITLLTLHTAKGLEFPVVFLVGLEEGILPHSRTLENEDAREREEEMAEERRLFYVGVTRAKRRLYLVHCFRRSVWGDSNVQEPSRFLDEIPTDLLTGMVDKRSRREAGFKRMTSWEGDGGHAPRSQTGGQWSGRSKSAPPAWGQSSRPADSSGDQTGPGKSTGPAKNSYWSPGGGSKAGSGSVQRKAPAAKPAPSAEPVFKRRDSVQHASFGVGTVIESIVTRGGEEVTVAFPGLGIKKLMAEYLKKL